MGFYLFHDSATSCASSGEHLIPRVFTHLAQLTMNVAQALDVFLAHPKNKDIAKWALDDNEWKALAALQDFEAMLQVLHKYQQAMYRK